MNTLIIKFGGSILTDKTTPFSFNAEICNQLAKVLNTYRESHRDTRIAIVHGAGSFAHPTVKEYQLHHGFNHPEAPIGLAKTEYGVRKLNSLIVDIFLKYQLPLFSLSCSSWTSHTSKDVFVLLESLWAKDLIPTLYGDVTLGTKKDISITSGDLLVKTLAQKYSGHNCRIIMIGDTPGVLDENANTLLRFDKDTLNNSREFIKESQSIDVTGGMFQKLQELSQISSSTKIILTNPDNFHDALNEKYTQCTQIG